MRQAVGHSQQQPNTNTNNLIGCHNALEPDIFAYDDFFYGYMDEAQHSTNRFRMTAILLEHFNYVHRFRNGPLRAFSLTNWTGKFGIWASLSFVLFDDFYGRTNITDRRKIKIASWLTQSTKSISQHSCSTNTESKSASVPSCRYQRSLWPCVCVLFHLARSISWLHIFHVLITFSLVHPTHIHTHTQH